MLACSIRECKQLQIVWRTEKMIFIENAPADAARQLRGPAHRANDQSAKV